MTPSDQLTFGPRDVSFGRAIAEIPGHYRVSVELYLAGDLPGALLHASHPLMEVLPSVYEDLLEHGLAADLARSLGRAASVLRERRPAPEVNSAFEDATRIGQGSIEACVGPASSLPAYQASVIAALLRAALTKYESAIGFGRVSLVPEYQDAYGFIRQVERMAEGLMAGAISGFEFLSTGLAEIAAAVPGPRPPDEPTPVATVATAITTLREELAARVGAILRETPTPREAHQRIEYRLALLADVLRHDEVGRAEKLVARIYAEDYIDLQAALETAAPRVHEELAQLIGRDLRLQINRGESKEAIAVTVWRVIELLSEAISVIEEE